MQDGAPISFQLRATFAGPTLKLLEPIVDYGLVKINTTSKFRINVENSSPIPGEVLIRSFNKQSITFDNYSSHLDELRTLQTA